MEKLNLLCPNFRYTFSLTYIHIPCLCYYPLHISLITGIVRSSSSSSSSLFRRAASSAAASSAPAQSAAPDAEHSAWLQTVKSWPVKIPSYHWTLEWALPTPVPLHQFEQSPIVIEVKDRNPSPDDMTYIGPNVVAGYVHPETGKIVKDQAEHAAIMKVMASEDAGSHPPV